MCQFVFGWPGFLKDWQGRCINRKWLSWDRKNYIFQKVTKMGSIIGQKNRLKWGGGSERPAAHTQQTLTQVPTPPPPGKTSSAPIGSQNENYLAQVHALGVNYSFKTTKRSSSPNLKIFLNFTVNQLMLTSPRNSQRRQSTFHDATKAFNVMICYGSWQTASQRGSELLLETNLVEKEPWEHRGRAYQSRDTANLKVILVFDKNFTLCTLCMYLYLLSKRLLY